ncbi:MAG TPA: DUF2550 domain-containing protein [Intrasporangium sp.]|uniref:DUF2550 domain-containing protein n=1 Tax=Intrasporangium sp. TaxID=1925024 RepID=UPI002D7681D4|nr:DUF2550 domain-containing protein [Intrasporangium sp.]HET7399567.1 DUF2550 domain-containing protein [Intrasporangium sp.]
MPPALVSIEIAVGTVLVLVLVLLAGTYVRRRLISGGLPLTLCGLRHRGGAHWRMGLLRFGDNALEWYTLGGFSLRPRHRWPRQALVLEAPVPLGAGDTPGLLPGASRVPAADRSRTFELALQGSAYTALRSWQEAAPPGYNVNVA